MAIDIPTQSVMNYPGVESAMSAAGITTGNVEAVIADAIGQAVAMAPALAEAEGVHANSAASVIRPAVVRWVLRSGSGAGRQRTATAGSFSINESTSENTAFFELSEERKLGEIAIDIDARDADHVEIVPGGAPRYTWAGGW